MRKLLMFMAATALLASCGDGNRTDGAARDTVAHSTDTISAGEPQAAADTSVTKPLDMAAMNILMVRALGTSDSLYDRRFIDLMIPYHEAAIVLAQDALTKATRPEIRKMARLIVETQRSDIDTLREMRKRWYGTSDSDTAAGQAGAMKALSRQMVLSLGAQDSMYEERFITAMIPHHHGVTMMGRNALVNAKHPELQGMAEHMAKAQEKEITEMERLRAEWYGH